MKKTLALALVLTFALAIPAFAVELSEGPIAPDANFTVPILPTLSTMSAEATPFPSLQPS